MGQRHASAAPYPRERHGTHFTGGWGARSIFQIYYTETQSLDVTFHSQAHKVQSDFSDWLRKCYLFNKVSAPLSFLG